MHVASRSAKVKGAILVSDTLEGLAVKVTDSGTVNGLPTDLVTAAVADSGLNPVWILAAAPDNYDRPTDSRQYRAGWKVVSDKWDGTGYADPVLTTTQYKIGVSNLYNPTIPSGYLVNLHKGGHYTIPTACYVDSTGIKVPGNPIEVGANGKWQYALTRTNAVGEVVHYRSDTGEITIELYV